MKWVHGWPLAVVHAPRYISEAGPFGQLVDPWSDDMPSTAQLIREALAEAVGA